MSEAITKQRIWNAFHDLLQSKHSINKITVELIIKKSGVAKSTFYRHFRDKFDVLNYNSMSLAEHLIGHCSCTCWKGFLLCMFQGIAKDIHYYKKAFHTFGQNDHTDFLYNYSFSIVEKCYLTHNKVSVLPTTVYYMIAHYCHGCVGILKDWLNDPDSLTPDEMADIFYDAMPFFLRDTWFKS